MKKGAIDEVREWFQRLEDRKDEVLETLENEKTIVESVFLDKCGEDFYLIYYIKAENVAFAREVAKQSLLPIDLYHKKCREKFCEKAEALELLVDFQIINF